jgi:hypothetical protein
MTEQTFVNIQKECERIEEDMLHSGKSHYNAASMWAWVHYLIGIPMTICAAWAGINAFSDDPHLSGYLALTTAALAALQTFMGASDKSIKHKNAGNGYFSVKNTARFLREVEMDDLGKTKAVTKLRDLMKKRDELNNISPSIPYPAFLLARRSIDKGCAEYRADKGEEVT